MARFIGEVFVILIAIYVVIIMVRYLIIPALQ